MLQQQTNQSQLQVVYIITKLELGGAQKVCLALQQQLAALGHQTVLVSGPAGQLVAQLAHTNAAAEQVILLPNFQREVKLTALWRELVNFRQLVQTLQQLRQRYPHLIVHTHSTKAGLLGRWAAYLAGIRTRVHTIHGYGFHAYQNKLVALVIYLLELVTSLITTHYVCVSERDLALGTKLLPRFRRKAQLIRAAVDVDLFQPARRDPAALAQAPGAQFTPATRWTALRAPQTLQASYDQVVSNARWGQAQSAQFIVGTVACFKPQKNLFDLLLAFQQLRQLAPQRDYRLELVGDGALRVALERWIREHDLSRVVKLHGWCEAALLPGIMARWQVFALTSLWEGLPCAVVEARLLQLPVVAYDVGGIREVIKTGQNGLLYRPGQWSALAQGLYRLSQEAAFYQALCHYPDELSAFTYQAMMAAHVQLYTGTMVSSLK